jgi:hypothetical protein
MTPSFSRLSLADPNSGASTNTDKSSENGETLKIKTK